MRVKLLDLAALSDLAQGKLELYLRRTGWVEGEQRGSAVVWSNPQSNTVVLLPTSNGFIDYPAVVQVALQRLAEVEGRSQVAVYDDIEAARSDIFRLSVPSRGGRVPLSLGRMLVDGGNTMLSAAAASAVKPAPFHRSKRPADATAVSNAAKLEQTERGSFVVRISIQHPEPPEAVLIDVTPEPFSRKATKMLASALLAVRASIDISRETGELAAFQKAVSDGVSGNLCEALSEIVLAEAEGVGVSFGMVWSPLRNENPSAPTVIRVAAEDSNILTAAAELLKGDAPVDDYELMGAVVRLERSQEAATGTVTIADLVDGRYRFVKLELDRHDYDKATECHSRDQLVTVTGTLRRDGKTWRLANPTNLAAFTRG